MSTSDRPSGQRATTQTASQTERSQTERSEGGLRTDQPQAPGMPSGSAVALTTSTGTTRIADGVVAKIAGLAARDIPGVFSMGTGMARRMGQLKALVPGTGESASAGQGVSVEVGEREAAIDLDIITWYGQSIVDVSDAVRRNVIGQVEGMTGLKVVEVNIQVGDIHVETDEGQQQQRVQ